jgi:hypothetical protein
MRGELEERRSRPGALMYSCTVYFCRVHKRAASTSGYAHTAPRPGIRSIRAPSFSVRTLRHARTHARTQSWLRGGPNDNGPRSGMSHPFCCGRSRVNAPGVSPLFTFTAARFASIRSSRTHFARFVPSFLFHHMRRIFYRLI